MKRGTIVTVPIGSNTSLMGQITDIDKQDYFVEFLDFHHTACPDSTWLTRDQFDPIELAEPMTAKDREWDDYPSGTEVEAGAYVFRRGDHCWIRDVRASHTQRPDPNVTSIRVPVTRSSVKPKLDQAQYNRGWKARMAEKDLKLNAHPDWAKGWEAADITLHQDGDW